jgi:allantoin racemase
VRRILALNVDADFPESRRQQREEWLAALAGDGWIVRVRAVAYGPRNLELTVDQALAVPAVLEGVARAEKDGYDAVMILCMTDPGLDACRELVDIPVVGTAQAACLTAVALGLRFSIVTLTAALEPLIERTARASGVNPQSLASVRSIGMSIPEMAGEPAKVFERLVAQGRLAVQQDGAHSIVLGCTGMAGIAAPLSSELGVPVVDPNVAGLWLSQLMVSAGLKQSRQWYPLMEGGWAAAQSRLRPGS